MVETHAAYSTHAPEPHPLRYACYDSLIDHVMCTHTGTPHSGDIVVQSTRVYNVSEVICKQIKGVHVSTSLNFHLGYLERRCRRSHRCGGSPTDTPADKQPQREPPHLLRLYMHTYVKLHNTYCITETNNQKFYLFMIR